MNTHTHTHTRTHACTHAARTHTRMHTHTHSQHSNMLNQARLMVLKTRDEQIKVILEEAKEKLSSVIKDKAKWKKMLADLVTQVSVKNMCALF